MFKNENLKPSINKYEISSMIIIASLVIVLVLGFIAR
jgi:hypothetical protein